MTSGPKKNNVSMFPARCHPSLCEKNDVTRVWGFLPMSSAHSVKCETIKFRFWVCHKAYVPTFAAIIPPITGAASPCGSAMNERRCGLIL